MTYRAIYYTTPDGQSETVLLGPEHAGFRAAELESIALEEAERAGLIGEEYPQITIESLVRGLRVGPWSED